MDKATFNQFVKEGNIGDGMDATRKRMNKKSHKKRNYGHAPGETGAGSGTGPAVGESYTRPIIQEIMNSATAFAGQNHLADTQYYDDYEEDAEETEKKDQAAAIFRALYQRKDLSREDIIQAIEQRTGVTNSTAVSYYQRIAKEMGVAGHGRDEMEEPQGQMDMGGAPDMGGGDEMEELPDEEMDDEEGGMTDEEPILRTVDGAHLVKKEQGEDGKFEELWVYNVGKDMQKALKVRKDILAGTDIGDKKTKSEDGEQSYEMWTLGNAQMLHIKGLAN